MNHALEWYMNQLLSPTTSRVGGAALGLCATLLMGAAPLHAQPAPAAPTTPAAAVSTPRPTPTVSATLSLQEVFKAIEQRNERWEVTEARIAQSRAERRQAFANFLPSVSLNLSGQRNNQEIAFGDRVIRPQYNWSGNASAQVDLLNLSNYPTYRAAKAREQQVVRNMAWQRRVLRQEAELAYITLKAAQADVAIVEQTIALRQENLKRAEALVTAQLAVPIDVARAKNLLLDAQRALLDAQVARGDASDSLAVLVGQQPGKLIAVTGALDTHVRIDARSATLSEGDLFVRADLEAQRQGVVANQESEDAIFYRYFPTLVLGLNTQFGPATLNNPDGYTWTLSLSLSWLIYDGGLRAAQLDATRAQTRALRLERQLAERTARAEVVSARREFDAARAAISVAEEQVKTNAQALELARRRFDSGLASTLEVNDASQALLQSQLQLNRARLRAALAAARHRYLMQEDADAT